MDEALFLDAYALVEVAAGSEKGRAVLKLVKQAKTVYTGSLNLYELWYLVAAARGEREADRTVLAVKSLATSVPAGDDECVLAARLKKAHSGKKIGAVDFVTAASAVSCNAVVLTGDPHFQEIIEVKTRLV